MHLVDDEHLVAVADRRDREAFDDDLTDVVDTGVGRRIDFQHVDVAALSDLDAGVAHPARIGRRPLHAVERAGQDAGGGGLAAAARAGEHERLGDAPALEGVAQRLGHGLLAEHVLEALGPPLAGENLVGHGVENARKFKVQSSKFKDREVQCGMPSTWSVQRRVGVRFEL